MSCQGFWSGAANLRQIVDVLAIRRPMLTSPVAERGTGMLACRFVCCYFLLLFVAWFSELAYFFFFWYYSLSWCSGNEWWFHSVGECEVR